MYFKLIFPYRATTYKINTDTIFIVVSTHMFVFKTSSHFSYLQNAECKWYEFIIITYESLVTS